MYLSISAGWARGPATRAEVRDPSSRSGRCAYSKIRHPSPPYSDTLIFVRCLPDFCRGNHIGNGKIGTRGRGVVEEQSGDYSIVTRSVGTYTEVLHSAGQRLAADPGGH